MKTLLAGVCLLLLLANSANAQKTPPPGVSEASWRHLQAEIDKGKNPDDPGKLIRYWFKLTEGEKLTDAEHNTLVTLVNRQPKRGFGFDSDVYSTAMAVQLLELESRNKRDREEFDKYRKSLEEFRVTDQARQTQLQRLQATAEELAGINQQLLGQITELQKQIKALNTVLSEIRTTEPKRKRND